jgi:hypothetical protein
MGKPTEKDFDLAGSVAEEIMAVLRKHPEAGPEIVLASLLGLACECAVSCGLTQELMLTGVTACWSTAKQRIRDLNSDTIH